MRSVDRMASQAYRVGMPECPPHDFESEGMLLVCKRCGDVDLGMTALALAVADRLRVMGVEIVDDFPDADAGR